MTGSADPEHGTAVDANDNPEAGTGPGSWSAIEKSLVVAIALAAIVGGAVLSLTLNSGEPSTAGVASAPPGSVTQAAEERISASEFRRHLDDLRNDINTGLDAIVSALEVGDLEAAGREADRMYLLLKKDEDWQRENVNLILGACYDDAAEAYSNGHTAAVAGFVRYQALFQTRLASDAVSDAEAASGFMLDAADYFAEADRLLAGRPC